MVLAHDTPLMLFDEPVTFLDIKHQWSLLELLTNLAHTIGKTLVVVFHDINHAMAACRSVVVPNCPRLRLYVGAAPIANERPQPTDTDTPP